MFRKRLLLLILLLIPAAAAAAFPTPTGFVNDFAGVLPAETKNDLEGLLSSFERSTGIEVAVATLPSLDGRTVEDVAVDLFKQWGIGKKGKDDGALFLVAPSERRMRIEVGYGLEGALNDALAGRILDENVVPRFRGGDLSGGIAAGTAAIVRTIVQREGLSFDVAGALKTVPSSAATLPPKQKQGTLPLIFKIIGLIIMAYLFIRHPWLFLLLLSTGGGRGGGGGFSGGFGGFGGGGSGGGGASRSW